MKPLISLILSLIAFPILGQEVYFSNLPDNRFNITQVNELLSNLNEKSSRFHIVEIYYTDTKDDSIIHHFNWRIVTDKPQSTIVFDPLYRLLGKTFPEFALIDLKGDSITLNTIKGKPTFIYFWFTACKPCREKLPELNRLKFQFESSVNFIAVTFEPKENLQEFLRINEFSFQQVYGEFNLMKEIGIEAYPRAILLAPDGTILRIHYDKEIPKELEIITAANNG